MNLSSRIGLLMQPSAVINKLLKTGGYIKVMGYSCGYLLGGDFNTRVHLNNFISGLYPEYSEDIDFHTLILDSSGRLLHRVRQKLGHGCFAIVDLRQIFGEISELRYGQVISFISVNRYLSKFLISRNVNTVGCGFFATWEYQNQAVGCSHAIEAFKGEYFEIPQVTKWLHSPTGKIGHAWSSNRSIAGHQLSRLMLIAPNPTNSEKIFSLSVTGSQKKIECRHFQVMPRGTALMDMNFAGSKENRYPAFGPNDYLTVSSNALMTANAKPYMIAHYGDKGRMIANHL